MAGTDGRNSNRAALNVTSSPHRQLAAKLGRETIERTIDDFYERVRRHPNLAPYFAGVKDWDETKAHIAHFWWIDLGGRRYRPDIYNPTAVHRHLNIPPEQVDPWLELFVAAVADNVAADLAEVWLARVRKMAEWIRIQLSDPQQQADMIDRLRGVESTDHR